MTLARRAASFYGEDSYNLAGCGDVFVLLFFLPKATTGKNLGNLLLFLETGCSRYQWNSEHKYFHLRELSPRMVQLTLSLLDDECMYYWQVCLAPRCT